MQAPSTPLSNSRAFALGLVFILPAALGAAPKIDSVFPLAARPGATLRAQIRGTGLHGAHRIWFPESGIRATVLGVETEPAPDPKKKPVHLLQIELTLDPAPAGPHREFRVVTPTGISNALRLHILPEPPVDEDKAPHDLPNHAQPLAAIPVTVHGRIAQIGEVDYYSFRAAAGEELWFRTLSSAALDPALAIYKLTGSWFDPDRATRLAFSDEPVAYPGLTTEAALHYKFDTAGDYLVRINGFWGNGGPGQDYALVISRQAPPPPAGAPDEWDERTWTRPLTPDRMALLEARALPGRAQPIPIVDADAELTEVPPTPQRIPLPALVTGTIERPGDIDRVHFAVKEGDRLVFEIQTPETTLPLMNPLLRVIDADGVEALTNILSVVNSNGNVSKQIHPKTQYSFPRAGEFTLEIRDITAAYGDRSMRYSVMVRPQSPHMGAIAVDADCLNLIPGKAQKLSIVTEQEEGFDGYVVLSIEDLPPGVRAVTATEVEPDSPPSTSTGKRERFTAKSQKATLLLIPQPGAPLTPAPVIGRVYAQPVVKGELGKRFLVKEIPIMLVNGEL